MITPYKIAGIVLIVIAASLLSLSILLSYDAACEPAPVLSSKTTLMKAIVYRCYGSADVLNVENIEKPSAADNEILVKVHAASVNPVDWHYMRGSPNIMRLLSGMGAPEYTRLGIDFAGVIEAVGKNVKRFQPGDEVFGGGGGAFAEYLTIGDDRAVVLKPSALTFEQAASIPVAAISALQALRDKGKIKPGQKVLINGASGGVGTFAVQIAKSLGAEVTGVCSTRNLEMVRSIGADHVIDYTREDFTENGRRYDLIIDNVGNHSLFKSRKALTAKGILVRVGGPSDDVIDVLTGPITALVLSPFVDQSFPSILAELNQQDMGVLSELMQAGKVVPVIDRRYPLDEVPAAIRYSEEGHARGKIIVEVEKPEPVVGVFQ